MLPRDYIEKIVQKPIPLPAVEQIYIDQFLDIHLDGSISRTLFIDILQKYSGGHWTKIFVDSTNTYLKFRPEIIEKDFDFISDKKDRAQVAGAWKVSKNNLFDTIGITKREREKFEKDFPYVYQTQIRKLFKTLRHVKRYLNGLRSTLPPIKDEVNLYEFFILEIIRIFYPKVYDDIWHNPWFYIPLDWSDTTYLLSPFKFVSNEDEKYTQIKKHIENIIGDEKEVGVVKELLKTIFFVEVKNALERSRMHHNNVAKTYRAEKRITHPDCFRKYFMLKVSPLELPDEFIETTLDLWHSAEKNKKESVIKETIFGLQKREKLLEFFKKLMVFLDKIQNDIVPDIVRVIYKNVSKFSKKGTKNFWNSEYDKSLTVLLWLINDKIDKNRIQSILEEVITKTSDFPYVVEIILFCLKERGGSFYNIYDSIKLDELQNTVVARLEKYFIDENRDIFADLEGDRDWGFVLYQWATHWGDKEKNNKNVVTDYLIKIFEKKPQRLGYFLKHFVREGLGFEKKKYFDYKEFKVAYDPDKFVKCLSELGEKAYSTESEKEAIELFLEKHKKEINKGNPPNKLGS